MWFLRHAFVCSKMHRMKWMKKKKKSFFVWRDIVTFIINLTKLWVHKFIRCRCCLFFIFVIQSWFSIFKELSWQLHNFSFISLTEWKRISHSGVASSFHFNDSNKNMMRRKKKKMRIVDAIDAYGYGNNGVWIAYIVCDSA